MSQLNVLLFAAITLMQIRVSMLQIAGLYSTTLERSAVEFAADYINQQLVVDPLYPTSLNVSERRDATCDILSNASGLVVPRLTVLSHEILQSVTDNTQFPTTVAQSTLTNVTTSDSTVTWRSTARELLDVIQSVLAHMCPSVVVLVESTEDVPISLASVLPAKLALSDDVTADVIIMQYSTIDSLIENPIISASEVINASNASCALNQSQSGIMFIINSPVDDANTILNYMSNNTDLEDWLLLPPHLVYNTNLVRWLLLPHLMTSYVDDLITNNEMLWSFSVNNVQGLQIDSLSTQEFTDFQNHWLSANKTMFPDSSYDATEFAYDVYKAVLTLLDTVNMSNYDPTMFNCSSINLMSATYTSPLVSNDDTSISHRNYTIWNITSSDLSKFGRWSSDTGFVRIDDGCTLSDEKANTGSTDMQFQNNFTGIHFNIVTIEEMPFVMNDTGELEGFCIDLLEELSDMMGFTYDIYIVEDGSFGGLVNGAWNGIIGDIIQEKANLSVAPLTINVERIKVVDFTKPYIELGTLILLYKEPEKGFKLFRFTEPLSTPLLILFVVCWPIVGLVAWIAAASSPYDRSALKKEKKVDALYGFSYSIWAQYGSMTLQGSEYHPLSPSGRIVVVTWWFVILVLISCYTAQLAASLTTQSIARVINSINDLTNQDYVKYGTVKDSEVQEFFNSSNITTYRSALPTIRDNLYPTADAAVDAVCENKGRFAFIWDSIVIDSYIAQAEKCDLCSAGSLFDRKGYGLALPLNSSYTNDFTIAILKLRESQFLLTLRNKWIPMSDSSTCEGNSELKYTVTDIGDVFVVLGICFVVSFLVLLLEILWKYYEITHKIMDAVKGNSWKSIRLHGTSNRTAPEPSEHYQDNGSIIRNGELLTAPAEDGDATSTQSDGHLSNDPYTMFVKQKETLQESA